VKLDKNLAVHFSLVIFCVGLTGCGTIPSYEDKGGRYVEATYTHPGLWEPSGRRMALCYEYGGGLWHSTIWPDTFGIHVTNDVAVFIARKTARRPDPEWREKTDNRLFAVRWPEMPMDITDEVVWRCAKQPGPQLYATLESPLADGSWPKWVKQSDTNLVEDIKNPYMSIDLLEETNGALKFCGPYFDFHLDWNLVPDVMREVKGKGVVRKDRVWGTSYIEKEFKPEVQK